MALPWLAITAALSAIPGIAGMFKKKPGAPGLPEFEELLSPEEERAMIDMWTKDVGRDVSKGTTRIKTGLASRGVFRSGATQKAVGELEAAGSDALAKRKMDWNISKAQRKQDWRMGISKIRENRYSNDLNDWRTDRMGSGESIGQAASLIPMLADYYKGGGRNRMSGGIKGGWRMPSGWGC